MPGLFLLCLATADTLGQRVEYKNECKGEVKVNWRNVLLRRNRNRIQNKIGSVEMCS